MAEAVLGERRRSDQAHEGKSLRIIRLCVVCLEEHANSLNLTKNGKDDLRGSNVLTNTENWMVSMWSQWSSSG